MVLGLQRSRNIRGIRRDLQPGVESRGSAKRKEDVASSVSQLDDSGVTITAGLSCLRKGYEANQGIYLQ